MKKFRMILQAYSKENKKVYLENEIFDGEEVKKARLSLWLDVGICVPQVEKVQASKPVEEVEEPKGDTGKPQESAGNVADEKPPVAKKAESLTVSQIKGKLLDAGVTDFSGKLKAELLEMLKDI